MSREVSKVQGLQPILSLVSMIVIGVIFAEFVIQDPKLKLPIILFSFLFGVFIAVVELRLIVNKNKTSTIVKPRKKLSNDEVKKRMGRFVAELFEEDIPFDELEKPETGDINDLD